MNNHPAQILFIFTILLLILYVLRLRTIRNDRIVILLLFAGGIFLIINPGASTWVANGIGIGRGADLIFYIFILLSIFLFVTLYSEVRRLNRQMTHIVRDISLRNVEKGGNSESQPGNVSSKDGRNL